MFLLHLTPMWILALSVADKSCLLAIIRYMINMTSQPTIATLPIIWVNFATMQTSQPSRDTDSNASSDPTTDYTVKVTQRNRHTSIHVTAAVLHYQRKIQLKYLCCENRKIAAYYAAVIKLVYDATQSYSVMATSLLSSYSQPPSWTSQQPFDYSRHQTVRGSKPTV